MFSRRTHRAINLNETNKTNLEQNVLHSRIKQSNFKLLSLSHLKKKTLGTFLSKFKAVNVKGSVSVKFKKHSSLPLDSNKTGNQKFTSPFSLLNKNKNLTTSESNICENNYNSTIVNLISLNQNNEPNLVEKNSILEYLLKYSHVKEKFKENDEISDEDNGSNEEINLSTVIHSDSSGTEEENQTFVVLTDSDEELSKKTGQTSKTQYSAEAQTYLREKKIADSKQITVIPEWLQNYAASSSTNGSFSIPWNKFNLEQLNLTDIMLQRIYNIECEQIILKYENYRNLLLSQLNRFNHSNIFH